MKFALTLACFSLLGLIIPYSSPAQCLELVWSDEFNTNGPPNPEYWGYDLGSGNGWGNQEIQAYTNNAQNVRVEDGKLKIQAIKQNNVWTSARVKSQGKKSFKYGKIQFSAKLPAGSGTWPALWMLGENISSAGWPACGEIDVMEHVGKTPGKVHGSIHTPSSSGATVNTSTITIADFNQAFHDYEIIWTADEITFRVDGNAYYTYAPAFQNADTWPFDKNAFIIMNIAMGGIFGSDDQYETGGLQNGVDPNLTSALMEVDYVRVYQEVESIAIEGPSMVAPYSTGLSYQVTNLIEGTFNWTAPPGATITSGQGGPAITVDWGNTDGEVSVEVIGQCGAYSASLNVENVTVPQGASYILDDFEDNNHERWTAEPGNGNSFVFTESGGALNIAYSVTAPGANPKAVLHLEQVVDLSVYSKMRARVKTLNNSGTVNMRIDLFDLNGAATNATPVFKLEPLVDNGEYAVYEFDFSGQWGSSFPNAGALVDSSRVAGLNLYLDYGIFGSPGSDEVWLDYIEMVDPQGISGLSEVLEDAGFAIYPNPTKNTVILSMNAPLGQWKAVDCQLYNLQGVRLLSQQWADPTIDLQLNIEGLPAGMYLLALRAGEKVVTKKLFIE